MDIIQRHFAEKSRVEQAWLNELICRVRDVLLPVMPDGLSMETVALALVSRIQECFSSSGSLPLSFRCVCVSELLTRQRAACFSSLSMSTSGHQEVTRQAEQTLPNHRALSRANLLLIGCLTSGVEGWRVSDSSGSVHCELLCPDPSWMNQPMLFPSWNYITHNALPGKAGSVQEAAGHLELVCSPVRLTAEAVTFDPGGVLSEVLRVREAARRLKEKRSGGGGALLCVRGEVGTVSPLLVITGKRFFCFSLRQGQHTVPILVMDARFVFWWPCVCVGRQVCVSALRVYSLRGWAGHRVLSVTPESRLHVLPPPSSPQRQPGTSSLHTTVEEEEMEEMERSQLSSVQTLGSDAQASAADEQGSGTDMEAETAGPSTEVVGGLTAAAAVGAHARGCTVKVKRSKIISYKGVITAVTDQEAGLYMIDGKVGLLLAYQPLRGINSGLRPGAQVELQHVHFLFRPSISCYGPPTMLCACLRSSVRVTYFSPLLLAPQDEPAPSQSHDVLPRMLLERNLGVSEYLWLQHYSVVIRQRLCPRWVCEARACVVASRLLECVCVREERREPRDIYREMLQEPHVCPLNQYRVCSTGCVVPSVSEVCVWLEAECWSTLSLPSLLPTSEASGLMRAQLNPLLSWSFQTWSLRDNHTEDQGHQGNEGEVERRRPKKWALLVGMLESGPASATLKLRDQTGSIDIVLVEEEEEERVDEDEGETRRAQRAADNTAWLGCLVCVRSCTLVAERFLKTNFPSWSHLKEDKYITSKHCRVYLQLCVSDLQILSPSTAMSLLLAEREKKDGAREEEKTTRNGERKPSVDAENGKKDGRRGEEEMTEIGEKQPGVAAEESSKKDGMRGEGEGQATNEEQPAEKRRAKRTRGEEKEEDKEKAEERGMKQTEGGKGGEESGERNKCKRQRTGEHMAQGMLGDRGGGAVTSDPCVSVVFRVEAKQGVALRNHQLTSGATASPGLSLSFVATVTCFGAPQRWKGDHRNTPLQLHENDSTTPHTQIDLQFISSAVRWFPLLHPDSVYRLIALHTEDVSVLRVKVDMTKGGGRNHGNPSLVIQPRWRIHTLAHTPMVTQIGPSGAQSIKTVSQILHDSACSEIVSFCGIIAQRISLEEDQGKAPAIQSLIKDKGVSVDPELRFRLTVEDPVSTSSERLQVYVDLSQSPFIPGLLPGAHILLTDLQRCLSRKGNVYCRFLPISCVAVTSLASEQSGSRPARAPPPMMLLGEWGRAGPQDEVEGEGAQQRCMLGKVKCHVTCVLHLKLQWTCSLCGSIYKQEHCSRTFPSCDSNTAVFQAEAKVAVEDGTGEAQVWFSSELVPALLSLGATEWEGLQWRMKARGHLRVYTRGWDVVSDVNQQDPLVRYLCALCSSTSIFREITLTCQRRSQRQEMKEPRRMKRGEREFLSKFPSSLQLTCTHTH